MVIKFMNLQKKKIGKFLTKYQTFINPGLLLLAGSFFFLILPKKDFLSAIASLTLGVILVILSSLLAQESLKR